MKFYQKTISSFSISFLFVFSHSLQNSQMLFQSLCCKTNKNIQNPFVSFFFITINKTKELPSNWTSLECGRRVGVVGSV